MSHREPHAATEPRTGTVMGMRGCESATECAQRPARATGCTRCRSGSPRRPRASGSTRLVVDDRRRRASRPSSISTGVRLRRVWHHDAFAGVLLVGDAGRLHDVYGVLARGGERFSVAYA